MTWNDEMSIERLQDRNLPGWEGELRRLRDTKETTLKQLQVGKGARQASG
jgi:hypothetical protein